jgi:dCMP deaminase
MDRPTWEEHLMNEAVLASEMSTCESRKVGAVIAKDTHIISKGFNGPAAGLEHCGEIGGCARRKMPDYESGKYLDKCRAVHAEQNAINFAARYGISTEGATLYVNTCPCNQCMGSIINAGIKEVVYEGSYNSNSIEMAQQAGIAMKQYVRTRKK